MRPAAPRARSRLWAILVLGLLCGLAVIALGMALARTLLNGPRHTAIGVSVDAASAGGAR